MAGAWKAIRLLRLEASGGGCEGRVLACSHGGHFLSCFCAAAVHKLKHMSHWRCCINSYGDGGAGIFDVWQRRNASDSTVSVTGVNITKLSSNVEALPSGSVKLCSGRGITRRTRA